MELMAGEGGRVRLHTRVEITGDEPVPYSPDIMRHLICYMILARLSRESLVQAFSSLSEIYEWQVERELIPSPPKLARATFRPNRLNQVERKPFVLPEE
jgi:hypothetical protein